MQWENTIKEFSNLRVETLYGKDQTCTATKVQKGDIDVIVIGAGSKIHDEIWCRINRLVVDEGHKLFYSS